MEYVSVGFDRELGELIMGGPNKDCQDIAFFWLWEVGDIFLLIVSYWIAIRIFTLHLI